MRAHVLATLFVLALATLASRAPGQLTDIQPGRNFPLSVIAFGAGFSENIDVGDVDNDGDLDVVVANGGDGLNQKNRIYINLGGLQGGTPGTFLDDTGIRFAGFPNDRSRDCEFVDIDNDGDLDVHITNRGTLAEGGQPCRFYTNQGGLQGGTIGIFTETTDSNFGTLVSVPPVDQVLGGNVGPFRDYACDCDFADLDDDGDMDLFHSSYGPAFNGNRDSRIFLNDGNGVFNELWPWADPAADIKTHTVDLDLADFDGDFDIDIFMSSRDSQARVYLNNLYDPVGPSPFHDITQAALIDTGATLSGSSNFEAEFGDLDGDGDFDVWAMNYDGNADRFLRNNGPAAGGGFDFTQMNAWIKGDPISAENEVDFLDYDGDGDLDVFLANWSGINWLYQNGLAQGLDPDIDGLFHRTGTGLAPAFELPSGNGGQTLDADCADMDGDGDDDILLANDANQPNRYFQNILGVPDTHAPTFHLLTAQGDKPTGTDTIIHAQIRDNASYYITNFYTTELQYSLNGGATITVPMVAQGSMQFRGVIPDCAGTIAYQVQCTDLAGNTGVSALLSFVAGGGSVWNTLGFGLAGVSGVPALAGAGTLVPGSLGSLALSNAAPSAQAIIFVSFANTPTPFKGGTLITVPLITTLGITTSAGGGASLAWLSWPAGLPAGFSIYFQAGIADIAAPKGVSLSNALKATAP